MKKIVIPIIALLLVASMVACKGKGDEIQYTGDFSENSSSSLPSNNMNISSEPTSDNSAASTVLVALTTAQGETVSMVTTSEPLTAPPTIDYNPVDVPTSVPPIDTTYVNQPSYNFTYPSGSDSTTTTAPTTTEPAEKFVSVYSTETYGGFNNDRTKILLHVESYKFGTKMKKTTGTVIINFGNHLYKADCTVTEKLDVNDDIVIVIDPPPAFEDALATSSDEQIFNIEVPKGLIVSTKNIKNNKFTSMEIDGGY